MIRVLEWAALIGLPAAFLAGYALFYIYFTDSDPGRQPRLKRAMVCWWYHRWHYRDGGWGRYFCSSCEAVEYGRRRMDRARYHEAHRGVDRAGEGRPR